MPLWPYKIKLIIFYISFYLLIFIFIFSLFRFLLYYICRLVGFEFWILPEIFENDSFIPYYTFEKADDGLTGLIIRIIFIICTILYVSFVYFVPESYEGLGEILIKGHNDAKNFGEKWILFDFSSGIDYNTMID